MSHVRRCGRRRGVILSAVGLLTVGGVFPRDTRGSTTVAPFSTSDASYTALANQSTYAAVGAVSFFSVPFNQTFLSSGVLISPEWVLTAAHVVNVAESQTFNIGGTTWQSGTNYTDDQHFKYPTWTTNDIQSGTDIGLIHLSTPVTGIAPASRYYGTDEFGKIGTSVGFGIAGDGNTGAQPSGTGTLSPGVKRAVTNKIDAQGADFNGLVGGNFSSNIMGSDFDNGTGAANQFGNDSSPNTDLTSQEGVTTPGDSGGGVFININNRNYVAGATSFILTANQTNPGIYGDVDGWTRVSAYNSWIDDNIANYWNSSTSGTYGATAANWSMGPTPTHTIPGTGAVVGFNHAGSYTVTFGGTTSNYQLLARSGDVTLNLGGFNYNLTSTSYDGSAVIGRYNLETASITARNGNVISRDVILGQLSGASGRLTIATGATWTVNGDMYVAGSYDGAGGGGTVSIQNSGKALDIVGQLNIYGGGKVLLSSGGNKVLRTKGLTIFSGGKIDLADNDMIINYDGASPLTSIKSQIVTGRNGGNWAGNGITSSTAQSLTNTALGYGEASTLGLSSGTFNGVALDSTTLLVKYTYYGDSNLDGKVDLVDIQRLAANWNQPGVWTGGDFDYNGFVNVADLYLLAKDWQLGVSSPLAPSLSAALTSLGLPTDFSAASVPEPVGSGALLLAAWSLKRRRRSQR